MSEKDPDKIKYLVNNTQYPVLLKNVCNWPLLSWTLNDWSTNIGHLSVPFRCKPKNVISSEPCWERNCEVKYQTFNEFRNYISSDTDNWMYFDYKHFPHWIPTDSELFKQISWSSFGFPELTANESTLWVGSKGAHTPCHQDTYGRNIVVQVYGRKRWLLFPPESGTLNPIRVPYEESSIYSEINFASLEDCDVFHRLTGAKLVELEPGDALIVPPRWWHYVEHSSSIGITINTWLQTETEDIEIKLEEALVRTVVLQIVKDLQEDQIQEILNPNEDDLPDTPISVILSQLDKTTKQCIHQRAVKNSKKHKVSSQNDTDEEKRYDIDKIINDCTDIIKIANANFDELKQAFCKSEMIKDNEKTIVSHKKTHLIASLINSICNPAVIKLVKENLLKKL